MSVSYKYRTVLNGMYTNNLDGGFVIAHPFVQNFHLKENSSIGGLYENLSVDVSFSLFLPNTQATCKNIKKTHHRKAYFNFAYCYLFQK